MSFPSRFFGELQRRSVVKVAAGYAVSGWLLVQVASIVIPAFGWPDWVMRVTLIALVAGFPVACGLAWAYEWTTTGILRDGEEDESGAVDAATTHAATTHAATTHAATTHAATTHAATTHAATTHAATTDAATTDAATTDAATTDAATTNAAATDAHGMAEPLADEDGGRLGGWEVATVGGVMMLALVIGLFSLSTADAARPQHIAVLPFRVMSAPATDADLLAAGLVETLTSSVTQFGQFDNALWVVPAAEISSAMTPSAARERFGVSLVVSGSMQFVQQRVLLTLNLVDARTGRQVDSRQIDVEKNRVIDLQEEATEHLARMLNLRVSVHQAARLRPGRTDDPDAGRLYMEGRGLLRGATSVDDINAAIERFVRAVAIDSTFALAAAGLGEAYWQKYKRTQEVKWVNAAIWQSQRALAVDSTLAPVWTTLGILRSDQRHDAAAIRAFSRAISIDPGASDPYRHLATVYRRMGEFDRAEGTYREAIARQPEYWKNYNLLGAFYYGQGRYEDAVAQYMRGLRLAPANPSLLNNIAVAYWQMRKLDRAMSSFEKLVALDSTHASAVPNLATAYFYLGRFDDAVDLYQQALARHPKDYGLAGALADAQRWSDQHTAEAPSTYRRAIHLAQEHLSVRERDPWVLSSLSQYYQRLSHTDSAQVWLGRLEAIVDLESADVVMAFSTGALYETMGQRDEAWLWMQRALDRNYGWIQLSYSPFLADLRRDARVARRLRQEASVVPDSADP